MSNTIPRRLVYRALAQVLHGQARVVSGRTVARSVKRRGLAHEANAMVKEEGRESKAEELRVQAGELTRRIGDPAHYRGPGLDPVILGWLSVLALGHNEARGEIERIAGPGVMADVDWLDLPIVLDRLLRQENPR